MSNIYTDYENLLKKFLSGVSSAEDFQRTYMTLFKNETREMDDFLFKVLNELFGDLDSFCADPGLLAELKAVKPGFYLDEKALREKVFQSSQRLAKLQKFRGKGS